MLGNTFIQASTTLSESYEEREDLKIDIEQKESPRETDMILFDRVWRRRNEVLAGLNDFRTSVMTWNLLADGLNGLYGEKSKTFTGVLDKYLSLEHRVPLILAEIERCNCDVLCFQEFDFYKDAAFMTGMNNLGYEMGAKQTKKWSPILTISNGNMEPDAVAIFFKSDKYYQIAHTRIDQSQHKHWIRKSLEKNTDAIVDGFVTMSKICELMGEDDGPRIRLLMVDEISSGNLNVPDFLGRQRSDDRLPIEAVNEWLAQPKPPVSVGVQLVSKVRSDLTLYFITAHLVSSKRQKGEIQRMSEVQDLLSDARHRDLMKYSHTFLCLDMNATFEVMNGYLPEAYPHLVGSLPSNAHLGDFARPEATKRQFLSATRDYVGGDVEFDWTSWKKRAKDGSFEDLKYGVDFVFYPTFQWQVARYLGLPDEDSMIADAQNELREFNKQFPPDQAIDIESATPLPNRLYPSDHVAVCVEMTFVEPMTL